MKYEPSFLNHNPKLSEEQSGNMNGLNQRYGLSDFLNNNRSVEELEIDFIYSSAKIEGNTYDRADTEALLKYGQTVGGKKYTDAVMIINIRDAWRLIINRNKPVSFDLLKDIHYETMKGLLEKGQVGVLRDEFVSIGGTSYEPLIKREEINTEALYLFKTANKITDPFEKAIYLHCNIAYLQPFKDGNKRTARMIQTASLFNDDVIPLLFFKENVRDYISTVLNYYELGNTKDYSTYFAENYKAMFQLKFGVSLEPELKKPPRMRR